MSVPSPYIGGGVSSVFTDAEMAISQELASMSVKELKALLQQASVKPHLIKRCVEKAELVALCMQSLELEAVDDEAEQEPDDDGGMQMLSMEELRSAQRVGQIRADMQRSYYWSPDWSPEFYAAMCHAGFIAVAHAQDGQAFLLPEMQKSYAVLADFADLHVAKKVRKRAGLYRLSVDQRLDAVLAGIRKHHGGAGGSWVHPQYEQLLRRLMQAPTAVPGAAGCELRAHSVELVDAADGSTVVAGEVGYSIGSVYTSLTGFFDRATLREAPAAAGAAGGEGGVAGSAGKPKYDSAGTVQLVALGTLLRKEGFKFWNLGHPPGGPDLYPEKPGPDATMIYKATLGGAVLPRDQFLAKWDEAVLVRLPSPLACAEPVDCKALIFE